MPISHGVGMGMAMLLSPLKPLAFSSCAFSQDPSTSSSSSSYRPAVVLPVKLIISLFSFPHLGFTSSVKLQYVCITFGTLAFCKYLSFCFPGFYIYLFQGLGNNSADYQKLELTLGEYGVATVVAKVSRLDWLRNAAGLVDPNYWRGTLSPRPVLDWYAQ